jgi:hypothetical protein
MKEVVLIKTHKNENEQTETKAEFHEKFILNITLKSVVKLALNFQRISVVIKTYSEVRIKCKRRIIIE